MNNDEKIVPGTVLALEPAAAAELTAGLDEANRFVLAKELVGLALGPAGLDRATARTFGAVFGALGRARLKLHVWSMLTESGMESLDRTKVLHPHVAPHITAIFGMPCGEAGVGVEPGSGRTPEDREDIAAAWTSTFPGWAAMYSAMAAEARAAGTLLVEETV